jgi:hypothetical protein
VLPFSYGTACQAPRIACVATDSGRDGPEARRPAEPSSRRGPLRGDGCYVLPGPLERGGDLAPRSSRRAGADWVDHEPPISYSRAEAAHVCNSQDGAPDLERSGSQASRRKELAGCIPAAAAPRRVTESSVTGGRDR